MPGVAAAPGGEAGWGAGRSCIADALAAPADRSPVMGGSWRARPAARSVHVTIACRILHRRGSPSLMSHSRVQGAARQQTESWGWVRTKKDNTEQLRDSISQLCCINAPHGQRHCNAGGSRSDATGSCQCNGLDRAHLTAETSACDQDWTFHAALDLIGLERKHSACNADPGE